MLGVDNLLGIDFAYQLTLGIVVRQGRAVYPSRRLNHRVGEGV